MAEETVQQVRARIREIDERILELVCSRVREAEKIGWIKRSRHVPVRDFTVEAEVIRRAEEYCNRNGVDSHIGHEIAKTLIAASLSVQTSISLPLYEGSAKKILIIGGNGKMGRWYAHYFNTQGHEVLINDIVVRDTPYRNVQRLEDALEYADVILLSTPISATPSLLERITALEPRGLIVDGCSLKSPLLDAIRQGVRRGLKIASIHPLFGPDTRMLADRNLVICDCGNSAAVEEARSLFSDTSLSITVTQLEKHDEFMVYVLNMAHALNIIFFHILSNSGIKPGRLKHFASTTFTRQMATSMEVASENPLLYYEIQHLNSHRETVFASLEEAVQEVKRASESEDTALFERIMHSGREYFRGWENG